MAFTNEVVSDADIDRYDLPFQKGEGRWWTRDAERDYYLWGGLSGNPAYGTELEGKFYLYVDGEIHLFILLLGQPAVQVGRQSCFRVWAAISRIVPELPTLIQEEKLVEILKEALQTYGIDGQDDAWTNDVKVEFRF